MTRTISVDESSKATLEKYGIILKKNLKNYSFVQLNNYLIDTRLNNKIYNILLDAASNKERNNLKMPNFTLGIEFEFVGSIGKYNIQEFNSSMIKLLGDKYFFSGAYTHNDGTSWILGSDRSISYRDSMLSKPYGFELSSPKLKISSEEDMATLRDVINLVKYCLLGSTNESCGTHIHIGFNLKDLKSCIHKASIRDLLTAYSLMEKTVFDTVVPIGRRHNRFCKQTVNSTRNKYQKLSSRYCNFSVDGVCKNLRFEFRQLEGTLNVDTILYWAELQSTILYDLLYHIGLEDFDYIRSLTSKNIFDILFYYNFNNRMITFFINRFVNFRSRALTAA
jgi:hypothetical protein